MNSIFTIGVSGMQAAQARLDASSQNVAIFGTEGLRRQQVATQSVPTGGVQLQWGPAAMPGQALAADLVDQRLAQHLFSANLRTVQTADHLLGTLLDAVA